MAAMFHHVWGDQHVAHSVRIPCKSIPGVHAAKCCSWPLWPEGEDGKCDWCRAADEGTESKFVIDEEATAELHRVMAELREAREKGDGSYSRLIAEALGYSLDDFDREWWCENPPYCTPNDPCGDNCGWV